MFSHDHAKHKERNDAVEGVASPWKGRGDLPEKHACERKNTQTDDDITQPSEYIRSVWMIMDRARPGLARDHKLQNSKAIKQDTDR